MNKQGVLKETKLIRVGDEYHKVLKKAAANDLSTMTKIVEKLIKENLKYEN